MLEKFILTLFRNFWLKNVFVCIALFSGALYYTNYTVPGTCVTCDEIAEKVDEVRAGAAEVSEKVWVAAVAALHRAVESATVSRSAKIALSEEQLKDEIYEELMRLRKQWGLPAQKRNLLLDAAAQRHAEDANFDTLPPSLGLGMHIGTDGSTVGQRAYQAGYSFSFVNENLYYGPVDADPARIVKAWSDSTMGHREAMLKIHPDIGIGYKVHKLNSGLESLTVIVVYGTPGR